MKMMCIIILKCILNLLMRKIDLINNQSSAAFEKHKLIQLLKYLYGLQFYDKMETTK